MSTTEPTDPTPTWQIGDVANGHRLHEDGVWRPLPKPKPSHKAAWIVLVVLGSLVVLGVIGAAIGSSSTTDGFGARDACESWVKDQLKAPSTADFVDGGITSTGESAWTIAGQVDAENGFGAQVRTDWTCDVSLSGDTYTGRATLSN